MDGVSTAFFTKPSLTPERKAFYDRLDAKNSAPLWEVLGAIIPPEPRISVRRRPASGAASHRSVKTGW